MLLSIALWIVLGSLPALAAGAIAGVSRAGYLDRVMVGGTGGLAAGVVVAVAGSEMFAAPAALVGGLMLLAMFTDQAAPPSVTPPHAR